MGLKVRGTLGPRSNPNLLGPCVIEDEDGRGLATMAGWRTESQHKLACMFAAAPELYEALESIVNAVDNLDMCEGGQGGLAELENKCLIAEKALAKARGETVKVK